MRRFGRFAVASLVVVMTGLSLIPRVAFADTSLNRQKSISLAIADVWNRTHNEKAVQEYLRRQGLELISAPEIDPITKLAKNSRPSGDSSPSDMYIPGPTVYYDRGMGQYLFYFNWSWNSNCQPGGGSGGTAPCWYANTPWSPGAVGGLDGWGINVSDSTVLTLQFQQLVTNDNNGVQTWVASNASPTSGNAGAVVQQQDNWKSAGTYGVYDCDHGSFTIWMKPTGTHVSNVQIKSYVAHDWDKTGISSVSVSTSAISFNFSSTAASWQTQGSSITYYNF